MENFVFEDEREILKFEIETKKSKIIFEAYEEMDDEAQEQYFDKFWNALTQLAKGESEKEERKEWEIDWESINKIWMSTINKIWTYPIFLSMVKRNIVDKSWKKLEINEKNRYKVLGKHKNEIMEFYTANKEAKKDFGKDNVKSEDQSPVVQNSQK